MAGVELLLEGKTALITGGSRGIGAETVRLFRAAGARVAFSYRQAADRAKALEAELNDEAGSREQRVEGQEPRDPLAALDAGSGTEGESTEGTEKQAEEQGSGHGEPAAGSPLPGFRGFSNLANARGTQGLAGRGRGEGLAAGAKARPGLESGLVRAGLLQGTPLGPAAAPEVRPLELAEVHDSQVPTAEAGDTQAAQGDGENLVACVGIEQELETPGDGRALVEKAVAALGRLDILVVNHGIWPPEDAPISTMSEEQWRRTLGVNLDAVFGLVQAAVKQFEKQGPRDRGNEGTGTEGQGAGSGDRRSGAEDREAEAQKGLQRTSGEEYSPWAEADDSDGVTVELKSRPPAEVPAEDVTAGKPEVADAVGHIVLISSTAGQRGEAFHADYAASKGALISLTKSLSSELAWRGIRVNCVAPGWVETDMSAATLNNPELGPWVRAGIPVGRAATPREIAGPVLFLCTPLAGFISGEVLNVNGGAVLAG